MIACQRVLRRFCSDDRTRRYAARVTAGPGLTQRCFATTSTCLAKAPKELLGLKSLDDEEHHRLAREWTQGFRVDDIPKGSYETSYARSSGPGGQASRDTMQAARWADGAACEYYELQSGDQAAPAAGIGHLAAEIRARWTHGHGKSKLYALSHELTGHSPTTCLLLPRCLSRHRPLVRRHKTPRPPSKCCMGLCLRPH